MPDFLITYDLQDAPSGKSDPHKPFLTAAQKEGLLYVWKGKNYVSRLPNTTVWGTFANIEAADAAFQRALTAASKQVGYGIVREKKATASMERANVMSDVRKVPEAKWTGKTWFETSRLHQLNDPLFK
jgi:hypothetical protein